MVDSSFKDAKGTPIWFPKNNKPYFDKALQKTFDSKKEKHSYMKEKGFIMDGSKTSAKQINKNKVTA